MKTKLFIALSLAAALIAETARVQPAPYNDIGVTMGHWHIISEGVEANKNLFLALGGKMYMPGDHPVMSFPGLYINLSLGKGEGGTQQSVVNHVGFIVDDHDATAEKIKENGGEYFTTLPEGIEGLQAEVKYKDLNGLVIDVAEHPWQTEPKE